MEDKVHSKTIAITQTRHLELLQAERDHARRELRKVFGFTAMYCGDPSVKVILPEYLVEPVDIKKEH